MSEQKTVVAAYQYQFDGPYGPVWRNDSGPWNGQTPIATRALYAAPPAHPAQAQPARLSDGDIARRWFATTEEDEIWPSVVKFAHAIAAAVVPTGHVVVPEEPTAKMLANLMRSSWDVTHGDIELTDNEVLGLYRAMIAAAKATK